MMMIVNHLLTAAWTSLYLFFGGAGRKEHQYQRCSEPGNCLRFSISIVCNIGIKYAVPHPVFLSLVINPTPSPPQKKKKLFKKEIRTPNRQKTAS
jgi:hypothetical protein